MSPAIVIIGVILAAILIGIVIYLEHSDQPGTNWVKKNNIDNEP